MPLPSWRWPAPGSDRLDDLLLVRVGAPVLADVAAQAQHGDAVGDREDVAEIVRDEDDREPLLREPLDELEHLMGLRDAERRGRLVEDHELRVPHHGLGDRDGLPLATREGGDVLAVRPDRGDREAAERLARAALHRRLVEAAEPIHELAPEVHVLDDVQVVAEREILVDDLDAERGGVLRLVDRHVLALEPELAGVRLVDPGDRLDEGRLAGAVVADERHHLARIGEEVDVDERLDGPEALRDAAKLDRGGFGGSGCHGSCLVRGMGGAPGGAPPRSVGSTCSTSCTRRRRRPSA